MMSPAEQRQYAGHARCASHAPNRPSSRTGERDVTDGCWQSIGSAGGIGGAYEATRSSLVAARRNRVDGCSILATTDVETTRPARR